MDVKSELTISWLTLMVALRLILCLLDLPLVFEEGRCGPHLLARILAAIP